MSVVTVWRLFAYMDDDDEADEHRLVADWQIQDAIRWCVTRGYDHIYLTRSGQSRRFEKAPPVDGVTHYGIRGAVDGAHQQRDEGRPAS